MGTNISLEKVDLNQALQLVANDPGLKSTEYVIWFSDHLGCSDRTAKDALAVLTNAGYLDRRQDDRDRRVRRYTVSARGELVLSMPGGPAVLRLARGLFSTCASPRQVANRPGVSAARRHLERAESYLLEPILPLGLPTELPTYVSPLPQPPVDCKDRPDPRLIEDRRCKVCRSPYRAEIDLALAAGVRQADVRRRINAEIGNDHFTANNISRHLRNHVNEHDPRLRDVLQTRVDQAAEAKRRRYQHLATVVNTGLSALHAELTQARPRDLIRAVEQLDKLVSRSPVDEVAEVLREFNAFVDAVHEVIGDERWERVLAGYQRRRAKASDDAAYFERRRLLEPTLPHSY